MTNALHPAEKVTFSPFVIKKTGLQQATLTLGNYSLICIPIIADKEQISLLAALSKDEISFFQSFNGSFGGLSMVFSSRNPGQPFKLFARCEIRAIAAMAGRENAARIEAAFRPCPNDLIRILGEYQLTLMRLKAEQDDYRDKPVRITPESAREMGYNNYAVLTRGVSQFKTALYSLSTKACELLLPMHTPDIQTPETCSLKLFFQRYQFSVQGRIGDSARLPSGVLKLKLDLSFSPELVEILGSYFIQSRFNRRSGAQTG
jgi:hypothetical protein